MASVVSSLSYCTGSCSLLDMWEFRTHSQDLLGICNYRVQLEGIVFIAFLFCPCLLVTIMNCLWYVVLCLGFLMFLIQSLIDVFVFDQVP